MAVPVPNAPAATAPAAQAAALPTSPWVRNRTGAGEPEQTISVEMGSRHDSGLLERGVHTEIEHD
jgi:hypothetical protein